MDEWIQAYTQADNVGTFRQRAGRQCWSNSTEKAGIQAKSWKIREHRQETECWQLNLEQKALVLVES